MTLKRTLFAGAIALCSAMPTLADENAVLEIDGETLITHAPAPDYLENMTEVISGWVYRTDETQALQMDDFDNPAFVFVEQAETLFETVDGSAGKSCASCHSDVSEFEGLRAQLPRVRNGELETTEDLVNACRTERMGAEAWKWSGTEMSSMTALIGLQSRGMPVNVTITGDAQPYWEQGKALYYTRFGQLNVACSNCHEDNYGNNIRADHLSQGQINGFPNYRLKNARINTVHNRFKGCMNNIRAEPFGEGSDEFRALELYVASRGQGLSVEVPSVRN